MDSNNYLQIVVPTSDTAMCRKKSIHINMYICDAIWFSQFYSINQVYNTRCKTKIEVKNGSQFIGVLPLPLSGMLLYPRLPPSSPLSLFCQYSMKIGWVLFILLGGERHRENQVSWFSTQRLNTKTQHKDSTQRLNTKTQYKDSTQRPGLWSPTCTFPSIIQFTLTTKPTRLQEIFQKIFVSTQQVYL